MPIRFVLYLCACLSTMHAPRPSLVAAARREPVDPAEVARRQAETVDALQEEHPWLLSVSTIEGAPHVVGVRLSDGAPAGALDLIAAEYALAVDPPAPVVVQEWGCVMESLITDGREPNDWGSACGRPGIVRTSSRF